MEFCLGGDMGNNKIDGEAMNVFSYCTYIKNMIEKINNLFKTILNNYRSTLEWGYNPEVDNSHLILII